MIRFACQKLLAVVATGVLLASSTAIQADSWAIIVGVNEYPNVRLSNGSTPPPLRGAEADADAIANALVEGFGFPEEHVQLLKGTEATRAKLQTAFEEMTRKAGPDDVFVFHFSGHGTRVLDRRSFDEFDEEDKLDEALCLADTNGDGDNLLIDNDLVARFLPLSVVTETTAPAKPAWRELRDMSKGGMRRLTAFFACHAGQQAYERRFPNVKAPAKGGQFTQALLAGLRDSAADANKDGIITNQELLLFAAERLDTDFNQHRSRSSELQEPLLETDDADVSVFGRVGGR